MDKFGRCDNCANTGIVSASLVKNKETRVNEKVVVKTCNGHFNNDLADKSIASMAKMGIPLEVSVEDKKE